MKPITVTSRLLATTFLLAACQEPADDAGFDDTAVEDAQMRINGEVITAFCSEDEIEVIDDAMAYLVETLYDDEYLACMNAAIISRDDGDIAEEIVPRLRANLPTIIACRDTVCNSPTMAGCASEWGGEFIELQSANLLASATADNGIENLAGLIVHEVMHNRGYDHFEPEEGWFEPEDRFTAVRQAEVCIARAGEPNANVPHGRSRTQTPGDTELARVGGNGGIPFEMECPGNDVVRGMLVDSSHSYVNRLRVRCDSGVSPSAGTWNDSFWAYDTSCLSGQVAIGVYGAADTIVGELGLICADEDEVTAGDVVSEYRPWLGGSNNAGYEFDRTCPDGMAVKRIYGRAGSRIDQLRIVCEDYPVAPRGHNNPLPVIGTAVGPSRAGHCIGFGAMTGLWGSAGAVIDRVGGTCTPTDAPFWSGVPTLSNDTAYQSIEAFGGRGGARFGTDKCPAGQALVGFEAKAGARVERLHGICAPLDQWSSDPDAVSPTYTLYHGGANGPGTWVEQTCSGGEFVVGMEVWASQTAYAGVTVNGIRPICRRLGFELAPVSPPASDCCDPQNYAGCSVAAVESCVCGADPYCCDTQWDSLCSGAAPSCGASC